MALNFNGNTPKKILYNGLNVAKLVYNGVVVWMSKVLATISGILPLTLTDCTGDDLVDYKIYGNSEYEGLPDGYTQVEYIQGTGTQYIDIGSKMYNDSEIELCFSFDVIQQDCSIFGSRLSGTTNNFEIASTSNFPLYLDFGNYNTSRVTYNNAVINAKYICTISKSLRAIYDENRTLLARNTTLISADNVTPSNARIFDTVGGFSTNKLKGKVYYCKLWENGVLVRNMIPCKNPSNVAGLYDTVNGVFYTNAGTGTFNVGSVLPTGYTQVEYLESTGTQYIDTGFKPTGNTKVKIKVQLPTQTNVQQGIFGVRPGDTGRFGVFTGTRVDALRVNYNIGGALGGSTTAIPNFNATNVNEIEVSNKLIVNDVLVSEVNKTSFQSSVNLYLFTNNNNGTPQLEMQGMIWYCKIWDNDVLVRNFIPCKNPSNVAGMYDTVNGVFYANAGTGSFNVGSVVSKKSVGDLVTDTSDANYGKYKIPVLTNSHTTNIYLNKPLKRASKLPYGYTELEHIRSTGTQYINTGIKATEKTMVKAKLYTEEAGNKNWFGGTGQYNASYNFAFNSFSINQFEYSYGSSNWTRITISEEIVNRDFTVEFGNGAIKINDSLKVTLPNTAFTDNKDLCILVRNGGTGNIAGRVYYLKIYEAGVLVRNFIPCKDPSNVVGMYDTVNDVFYSNAGSGSFIAGAEVETVYYTDYLDYENQKVVRNVDDNDKGLDTPVEESVVLPAVATDEGTVTVDVDTEIAPSYAEIKYYKNGS